MKKLKRVVYTAVIGGIEELQDFEFIPSAEIDYICFTDNPHARSKSWKIVRIRPRFEGDPARSTREFKMLGHELLFGYHQWLWIDNKVRLLAEPKEIFESLPENSDLAMAKHDHRATVREEFAAVIKLRKDHAFRVIELRNFILKFAPEILDQQPIAGTIILRRNNQKVENLMHSWFELVLRFSKRDQLSINYVLEASAVSFSFLPIAVSGSPVHDYVSGQTVGRARRLERFPMAPSWRELNWALLRSYVNLNSLKVIRATLLLQLQILARRAAKPRNGA